MYAENRSRFTFLTRVLRDHFIDRCCRHLFPSYHSSRSINHGAYENPTLSRPTFLLLGKLTAGIRQHITIKSLNEKQKLAASKTVIRIFEDAHQKQNMDSPLVNLRVWETFLETLFSLPLYSSNDYDSTK